MVIKTNKCATIVNVIAAVINKQRLRRSVFWSWVYIFCFLSCFGHAQVNVGLIQFNFYHYHSQQHMYVCLWKSPIFNSLLLKYDVAFIWLNGGSCASKKFQYHSLSWNSSLSSFYCLICKLCFKCWFSRVFKWPITKRIKNWGSFQMCGALQNASN